MNDDKMRSLYKRLSLTSVFKGVTYSPVIKALLDYFRGEGEDKLSLYATFVSKIYEGGGSLNNAVKKAIFEDENIYVKMLSRGENPPEKISEAAKRELEVFSQLAGITRNEFAMELGVEETELPDFDSEKEDIYKVFLDRVKNIEKYGYGIFASHAMFRLSDDKVIEPAPSADRTRFSDFVGYEAERKRVFDNTVAFIEGRPAANTLLCGDAGTGKSSTVKAVANEFFKDGVRLIELRKDQLSLLPYVMGKISDNPLKFIIFIDDLSFNQNDDNFSMLKAALEGSASARTDNSVIYATSNRRHIVKESFAERDTDDVHRNDTMQETLSLSDRFGLVVLFSKPTKALYLEIVRELAARYGVKAERSILEIKAEEFALRKGNRSARCAEQFIKSLL